MESIHRVSERHPPGMGPAGMDEIYLEMHRRLWRKDEILNKQASWEAPPTCLDHSRHRIPTRVLFELSKEEIA